MIATHSLHKIETEHLLSFSPAEYSRFKFGDEVISEKFGTSLAQSFCEIVLSHHTIKEQIVVISSPYSFIPTATYAMKKYFVYELNNWLVNQKLPVCQEAKIHRTITYKDDYGALNAEERHALIKNDKFHIDKSFLNAKTLLFLDDIKITGSHEKMILRMVDEYCLSNDIYMLYFAELTNKHIHPRVENHLNYYEIKSIFDLDDIINNKFAVNTRVVKFILNTEFNAFRIFIENKSIDFVKLIYNMALGNGYHEINEYQKNLNELKTMLEFTYKLNKIN